MELVNARSCLLTNGEVYALMKELRSSHAAKKDRSKKLNTILYETVKYLESTPCVQQTPSHVADFVGKVKSFQLTRAEILQMLNLRPATPVEVQLIVEECEERLSEEQVEQLIDVVNETLPNNNQHDTDETEAKMES